MAKVVSLSSLVLPLTFLILCSIPFSGCIDIHFEEIYTNIKNLENFRFERGRLLHQEKKIEDNDGNTDIGKSKQWASDPLTRVLERYLDNNELEEHLRDFADRCRGIARLTTFGNSVKGAPLWALEISNRPGGDDGEPGIKLVGNMHGDETTGRVFTLALAEWLCENYKSDPIAMRIVEGSRLLLIPSMNPDGFTARTRGNANGVDLNRNFPDRFESMKMTGSEQPETLALMKLSKEKNFVASLAFHEGALVANYPWDGTDDKKTRYERCPDDATFKYLAQEYASNHRKMSLPSNSEFPNGGITNGAAWYPIYGSMQDWNYIEAQCMELTIESSNEKWPKQELLFELWEDNKPAILSFILKAAFGGLRGRVLVESSSLRAAKGAELKPIAADIVIDGIDFKTSTNSFGKFCRPLSPGEYTVIIYPKDHLPKLQINITVPADGSGVVRDLVLREHKTKVGSTKVNRDTLISSQVPGYNSAPLFYVLLAGVLVYGLLYSHRILQKQILFNTRIS